jgi:cell division protein FtsB
MPLPKPGRSQLAIGIASVIALTIVGGVVWGFGQQVAHARQMRVEEMRLERTVAAKQVYHDDLLAQLEYVRSEEYVEQWAREDAKMARSGEVVVVVSKEPSAELAVDAPSTPPSEPQSFWVELWELVFAPFDQ